MSYTSANDKSLFKGLLWRSVLTVFLIAGLGYILFGGLEVRSSPETRERTRLLTKEVEFSEVIDNFLSKDYEVLTRGSLYVKDFSSGNNKGKIIENLYDNIFFVFEKGNLRRINYKDGSYDLSFYVLDDGKFVVLDHTLKQYLIYGTSDDKTEGEEGYNLAELVRYFFNNEIFPIVSIVADFKDGKFNPIKRSLNVYSGQWRHNIFTSNEVCEVVLAVEHSNSTIKSISFSNTQPPSVIYFDFREIDFDDALLNIPSDYEKIPPKQN